MPALAQRSTRPRPNDASILVAVSKCIALGIPVSDTAQAARIGEQTFRDWYRMGSQQLLDAGDIGTEQQARELGSHALFAWTVKEAEMRMVMRNLAVVERDKRIPGKGWLPAMTTLERRRPQDFGRNQRIDITENKTVTYRLELGTALAAIMARAVELETVDPPQPEYLLPESTDPT